MCVCVWSAFHSRGFLSLFLGVLLGGRQVLSLSVYYTCEPRRLGRFIDQHQELAGAILYSIRDQGSSYESRMIGRGFSARIARHRQSFFLIIGRVKGRIEGKKARERDRGVVTSLALPVFFSARRATLNSINFSFSPPFSFWKQKGSFPTSFDSIDPAGQKEGSLKKKTGRKKHTTDQ